MRLALSRTCLWLHYFSLSFGWNIFNPTIFKLIDSFVEPLLLLYFKMCYHFVIIWLFFVKPLSTVSEEAFSPRHPFLLRGWIFPVFEHIYYDWRLRQICVLSQAASVACIFSYVWVTLSKSFFKRFILLFERTKFIERRGQTEKDHMLPSQIATMTHARTGWSQEPGVPPKSPTWGQGFKYLIHVPLPPHCFYWFIVKFILS